MSRSEKIWGWLYLAFSLIALPTLLNLLNSKLAAPLDEGTLNFAMSYLLPNFENINDSAITSMAHTGYTLTAISVVILAPVVEEVLYRGLIFRNLYRSSQVAAYLLSMAAFAAIHVLGYIGSQSVTTLVICFLQYLPAGLCLAWTYTKADNIVAPIVVHALVNAVAIGAVR